MSWANAFTGVQSALRAAVDGDTIRIAAGNYNPTTLTDRSISFVLRNEVGIFGGYAGNGAADADLRDIAANPTIFSGDIGVAGNNSDNSYHVVTASIVGSSCVLDGVSVTGGNASGSGTNQSYGGGMYNYYSSPTLTNCTFSGNRATLYYIASSGGGMYNYYSSPTLTNCTFSGNTAFSNGNNGAYGGGMYNSSSSPMLANCTFSGNSATSQYDSGSGGGMYNSASSSPTLTNCTFSGNLASGAGSGMYNSSSSPTLTNCTFTGNSASSRGTMFNTSSNLTLTNCTFAGNLALSGGGMYNASSNVTLSNCIIWGNSPASPQIDQSGGTTIASYCDIQGGFTGTGNINADPKFVRLPWTGPDGVYGTADDDYGNLRLRLISPAIDAGNNAAIPLLVTTDVAGNPRRHDTLRRKLSWPKTVILAEQSHHYAILVSARKKWRKTLGNQRNCALSRPRQFAA